MLKEVKKLIHVRQHFINGFGQKVEKIKTYQGELGSARLDVNGTEIFVNDIIKGEQDGYGDPYIIQGVVGFSGSGFYVETEDNIYSLNDISHIEVIGQKEKM